MVEQAPLHWGAEALWEELEPLLPGLSVEVLARTESTNSLLMDRARVAGRRTEDTLPCLLVAETQTRGRGRMGRPWHAEAGASLTFSLLLPLAATDWSGLSLAVGVAVAEALDPATADAAPRVGLKWPNDLWLADGSDRKLGGILIETVAAGAQRLAVVGIGLNVAPPHGVANAACLHDANIALDAPQALQRVALPLVQALQLFERQGFAAFATRFAARDVLCGRTVTTTLADLPEGLALGVSSQGALRVRVAGSERQVASGEVSVRPVAP